MNRESHKLDVERRKSQRQAEHQRRLTEQKVAGIARLASMHIAWSRVEAEIAKCSVRCANCHRRRTADMFGYWRSGVEQLRRDDRRALALGRLQTILG